MDLRPGLFAYEEYLYFGKFLIDISLLVFVICRSRCAMRLQQAVALCMDHCDATELTGDDSLFKTVVLAGGTACCQNLLVFVFTCNKKRLILPGLTVKSRKITPRSSVGSLFLTSRTKNIRPNSSDFGEDILVVILSQGWDDTIRTCEG